MKAKDKKIFQLVGFGFLAYFLYKSGSKGNNNTTTSTTTYTNTSGNKTRTSTDSLK